MINTLKRLGQKEQVVLLLIAVLLVIGFFYVIAWRPVNSSLQNQKMNYVSAQQTLAAVQHYAQQINNLESADRSSNTVENLTGMVNQTLSDRQLEFTRMQQLTADQLQIRLDNMDFGEVLAWLYEVEGIPGIIVNDLSARPVNTDQPGLVNVTVGLNRIQ